MNLNLIYNRIIGLYYIQLHIITFMQIKLKKYYQFMTFLYTHSCSKTVCRMLRISRRFCESFMKYIYFIHNHINGIKKQNLIMMMLE